MADSPFEFRVMEPEQRKGTGTLDFGYWVYRVRSRTSLPMYSQKETEVARRYSDFEWFRTQLCELYPFCIVPPIPEKDVQGTLNKFVGSQSQAASRLLEYRQRALRKFLLRVGAHPRLHTSQLLQDFLEMDETEWERRMKAPVKVEKSFVSLVGDGMTSALSRPWVAGGGASVATGSGAGEVEGASYNAALTQKGHTDPQVWEETKNYIGQLESSLLLLRDRIQLLVNRRKTTSNALHEFGVAFEKVGEIEKGMDATALSSAILAVGNHSEKLSAIYIAHADEEMKLVAEALTYYLGMCNVVRDTLRRVQAYAQTRDSTAQQLVDLTAQRDKAIQKGGQPDRVSKLENELQVAKEKSESANKELEAGEAEFKEELRRFHREKQYDMKTILKTFAKLQLEYASQMKKSWEDLLPVVSSVKLN